MTVVVTGGSGPIGVRLVETLEGRGHTCTIVSRRPREAVSGIGESAKSISYDEALANLGTVDAVVHLAARNNDEPGSEAAFTRDNVSLAQQVALAAREQGVKRFVFLSTTKALDNPKCSYGKSKAAAEKSVANLATDTFEVVIVRLPPVYGPGARGKLRYLTTLPAEIRQFALGAIRSIMPIVSIERAAREIVAAIEAERPVPERCVADPIEGLSLYTAWSIANNTLFVGITSTVLALPGSLAAFAIIKESEGGPMHSQPRVGKDGKHFRCHKLRTMYSSAPSAGTHELSSVHVTRIGATLRKFKLDELPQAWNVLTREMNLFGPRPSLPSQTEVISYRQRYGVLKARPGVTGLAQVQDIDMSDPPQLALVDHRYITFRSIRLDSKIAAATLFGRGFGDPIRTSAAATADRTLRPGIFQ